jgi:hypothetical protein
MSEVAAIVWFGCFLVMLGAGLCLPTQQPRRPWAYIAVGLVATAAVVVLAVEAVT